MEGNACELYICYILLSRGYAFCLVATVQFIKPGSNTDQRTELFVTNNNTDDNTAVNKIICLHNKNALTKSDHMTLNSRIISEINITTTVWHSLMY
jgi:hypothetical protein